MRIVVLLTILMNILALTGLIMGYAYAQKSKQNPKVKAGIGVLMGVSLCVYLLLIFLTVIMGTITSNILYLTLLIYPIIIFLIGGVVKYETLKPYSIAQICVLSASVLNLVYFIYF